MATTQSKTTVLALLADTVTTFKSLNATAQDAIATGAAVVFGVEIDCTGNTTEDVFVKFADAASVTPGTTKVDMVLKGLKSKTVTYLFKEGVVFDTNISLFCATEKGAQAGSTNPTGTVNLIMYFSN